MNKELYTHQALYVQTNAIKSYKCNIFGDNSTLLIIVVIVGGGGVLEYIILKNVPDNWLNVLYVKTNKYLFID